MSYELAPLDELETRLSGLAQSVQRKKVGQILGDTCRKIDELDKEFKLAAEIADIMALVVDDLAGVARENVLDRANKIWGIGEQAGNAVNQSQLDILSRDLARLPEWVKDLNRSVLEAWQARLNREFGPTYSLGKVLLEIEDTVDVGDLMTRAAVDALKLARGLPKTENDRQAFEVGIRDRNTAYSLLSDLGGEQAVIDFLQAVAEGQANLSHVTPDVAKWLGDRGALTRFKINL